MSQLRIGAIVSSAIGIVALFLPWFSETAFGVRVTMSLFDIASIGRLFDASGAGLMTFAAYASIALLVATIAAVAFYERLSPVIPHLNLVPIAGAGISLLVTFIALYVFNEMAGTGSAFDYLAIGFYVHAVAAASLVFESIALFKQMSPGAVPASAFARTPTHPVNQMPMHHINQPRGSAQSCANCGSALVAGDAFCNGCGQKVAAGFASTAPPLHSTTTMSSCAKCGSVNEAGSTFCESCGNKLPSHVGGMPPSPGPAPYPAPTQAPPMTRPAIPPGPAPYSVPPQVPPSYPQPAAPMQPVARTKPTIPPHPSAPHAPAQGSYPLSARPALPATHSGLRMPLVFLLETSAASGMYVNELAAAIGRFKAELSQNTYAAAILDVAVLQFGDAATVLQNFAPVANMGPMQLYPAGGAYFSQAVMQAVQLAESRAAGQAASYKPWIILVSGNSPDDDISAAAQMVQNSHRLESLRLMALSVGGHNTHALKQLTDVVFRIDGTDFSSFFSWLAGGVEAVAGTRPGEKPRLPQLAGNVYRER